MWKAEQQLMHILYRSTMSKIKEELKIHMKKVKEEKMKLDDEKNDGIFMSENTEIDATHYKLKFNGFFYSILNKDNTIPREEWLKLGWNVVAEQNNGLILYGKFEDEHLHVNQPRDGLATGPTTTIDSLQRGGKRRRRGDKPPRNSPAKNIKLNDDEIVHQTK